MTARFRFALVLLLAALSGAGPVRAAGRGFVLTTDYTTGTLSVVDLATRAVTSDVAIVSPDPFARWYDGRLYVVNRNGYDNVQVIAPSQGYATVRQFSTGSGTNPQDIAFVSANKAYVSRLGSSDLLIVDPGTGLASGGVSLAPWADADGNPEAARMVKVGDLLLVALQRLHDFVPADTGLVVVVDTRADTVFDADPVAPGRQVVRLPGLNPTTDFAVLREGGATGATRLLLGCTGRWGVADGGIAEIVVPAGAANGTAAVTCSGFVITESALGGDVADVVAYGAEHSYALVSDAAYNTSVVAWDPSRGTKLATLYSPGGYSIADLALDDRRELYVCNSSFSAPGLHVFAAGEDVRLAGPLGTGMPPVQIVFEQSDPLAAVPGESPGGLHLAAPAPNPTSCPARLSLVLPGAAHLRVEVFDPAGRRVRVLADGERTAGSASLAWDLRDDAGRRVAPGVYLIRAATGSGLSSRRIVVLD
jgi:hypothetical protein